MFAETTQGHSSFTANSLFIPGHSQLKDLPDHFAVREIFHGVVIKRSAASSAGESPEDTETPLEDAARSEREYVRQRLREELQREPTEEELDEWLRRHTEGY
jgi:hypothetical protein